MHAKPYFTPPYLRPEVQLPQHGLRPLHLPATGWVVPPRTIAACCAPASAFARARPCAFTFTISTITITIIATISAALVVVGGGSGGYSSGRDSEHEGEQRLRLDPPLAQGGEPGGTRGRQHGPTLRQADGSAMC